MGAVLAEFYDSSGAIVGSVPLTDILAASFKNGINKIGRFTIVVPAETVQEVGEAGDELRFYHEGETRIRYGIAENYTKKVASDGRNVLVIDGPSLADELRWTSTWFGVRQADDDTVSNTLTELITDATGWTRTVSGASYLDLSGRYDDMTVWSALERIATIEDAYIRETGTKREIEMKRGSADSGIVLMNPPSGTPRLVENANAAWVTSIGSVRVDGSGIINRIIPLGVDGEDTVYDLQESSRSSPYTITGDHHGKTPTPESTTLLSITTTVGPTRYEVGNISVAGRHRTLIVICLSTPATNVNTPESLQANGVEMTQREDASAQGRNIKVFSIENPPKGNVGLNARFSLSATGATCYFICINVQEVDVASISYADATNSGSSTAPTVAMSVRDDEVAIAAVIHGAASLTTDVGAALIDTPPVAASWIIGADGTTTLSWTLSGSAQWLAVIIELERKQTYYIEDSTSITAYGGPNALPRTLMLIQKAAKFVGRSASQIIDAADTLYDFAVTILERKKDPITYYSGVEVVGMPLNPTWLPGDSFRLWYEGWIQDAAARRSWLSVDATLFVVEAEESFDENGVQKWVLTLATQYEWPFSDTEQMSDISKRIKALEGV